MSRLVSLAGSAAVLATLFWGGLSASAQVTIRADVEWRAPEAWPTEAVLSASTDTTDVCGGPAVGELVLRGAAIGGTPSTFGALLSGSIDVYTTCGGASGQIAAGFVLQSETPNARWQWTKYTYTVSDSTIARFPLRATEDVDSTQATIGPWAFPPQQPGDWGCGWTDYACFEALDGDIARGHNLGWDIAIEGKAQALSESWPETVECGAEVALPVTAVRPDGQEGWVGRGVMTRYRLPVDAGGFLYPSTTNNADVTIPYLASRAGEIAYVAPRCKDLTEPADAVFHVTASNGGASLNLPHATVRVVFPPPDRLLVGASPDSVAAGAASALSALAVGADSTHRPLADSVAVTFSAQSPYGWIESAGGTPEASRTVTYAEATAGVVSFRAADSLTADTTRAVPRYHTPVPITASGGGVSGTGFVVVLGTDGPGPDSLGVTLAADSLDCGDSTAVSVRSLLAGVETPLDDTTRVLVAVLDSAYTRLAWGDTSGVALRIPYGEITQDSTVWLLTVDCADLDGPVPVGVSVSVDVPWLDGPLAGEAGGVLGPGGEFGAGGLYSVRLLRQNEEAIPTWGNGGYVRISKVRPDWLLPKKDYARFDPVVGPTPFANDQLTEPDIKDFYDPDTYRVEVSGLPDSLLTPEARRRMQFVYEVLRPDGTVIGNRTVTMVSKDPAISENPANHGRLRAPYYRRLVSNAEPAEGRQSCASWAGTPGSCRSDDDERGDQTILARLGEVFQVRVLLEREDGGAPDELGWVQLPVGQPPSSSGPDAIRRVDLVWHEYKQTPTGALMSHPDTVAARVSEDLAQASIMANNLGSVDGFATSDVLTVLSVDVPLTGAAAGGTLDVELTLVSGSPAVATVAYDVRDSAEEIATKIMLQLGSLGLSVAEDFPGDDLGRFRYVSINRSLSSRVESLTPLQNDVRVVQVLEPLEAPRRGSYVAETAGWARADTDPTTVDVFVVPRDAIQRGDPSDQTLAFKAAEHAWLFLPYSASDGHDGQFAHVASHELGHALLGGAFPGPDGGSECFDAYQMTIHHVAPYNLMYCDALPAGELVGGPKRLSEAQGLHIRTVDQQRRDGIRPPDDPLPPLLKW